MASSFPSPARFCEAVFHKMGRIPRPLAARWARRLGRLWFRLDHRHRNITLANLKRALGAEMPTAQRQRLARNVFENCVLVLFELCWSLNLTLDQLRPYFEIEGRQYIRHAHARGKGVLALVSHMGNWELLTSAAALIDYPHHIVYRSLDSEAFDRVFQRIRSRFGAGLIPKQRAMLPIYRRLRKGDVVAILLDQSTGLLHGVAVDFFGIPALTNNAMAMLALKTGAPVVPILLVRSGERYRVEISPAVPLIDSGDMQADLRANTQQYNRIIEGWVRRYPDQWFWLHQRWKKTLPANERH